MRAWGAAALLTLASCTTAQPADTEQARWARHASQVTITRDDWGIAHIRGRTDADAVFGMISAQAEDDYRRVETNYLTALGWTAQAEGEKAVWQDLRQRLYIDEADLRARYATSPAWLKQLMDAWADGLNHYLATHPDTPRRVITRWEPWMALSFTEGSIGGDIERIDLAQLERFYAAPLPFASSEVEKRVSTSLDTSGTGLRSLSEPTGSNGIAIAPRNTVGGNALLLINPHTSFFFRSEQQMTSDEGLNAYGAATWGQFFIYQGFNDRLGWMHTSSGVDAVDEFVETIERRGDRLFYRYGQERRPVTTQTIVIPYRAADGTMARRSFEIYRTHHGPIVRAAGDKWVSTALMHKPVEALSQSYLRTKARSFTDYLRVMEHKANSSNATVYADADGRVAYLHPQFVPMRDDRFDYTKPVDGSDPRTDWRGLHELASLPSVYSPRVGWIQNTNNWAYSAAGPDTPKREAFPRYMDSYGENERGIHAMMLLNGRGGFTLDRLTAAAYDPFQPGLARLVPTLVAAYDRAPRGHRLKNRLAGPVAALRGWDARWSAESVPNSLATFWAEALRLQLPADVRENRSVMVDRMIATSPEQKLAALATAIDQLEADFGSWRTPWGQINRFQRLTGDIAQPFSDAGSSIPVGFTTGNWGSLAVFGARAYPGTRRWYGTRGNSFVAVVEFGPRVRARAVSAGGQSGDPASPHFNDQSERYATGNLREVYFYPEQLRGHTERVYKPGR